MIQTIRDAESKIWTLQKEVTYLKTKINDAENQVFNLKSDVEILQSNPVNNSGAIDSIVNSDGTEVSHRLLHIFEKLKTKALEVVDLVVSNKATIQTLEVLNDAKVDHNLHVVNNATIDGTLNVTGTSTLGVLNSGVLNSIGPNADYNALSSATAIFGNTAGSSANGIYLGLTDAGIAHSWIQASKPGTANRPLLINPNGGGITLSVPGSGVIPDGAIIAGNMFIYQVGTSLFFRVRDSGGTLRQGSITIT